LFIDSHPGITFFHPLLTHFSCWESNWSFKTAYAWFKQGNHFPQ